MKRFDINALLNAEAWPHPTEDIQLIETHISWVILTGEYAYKIKKPVDFGFLDFSTLEKRRYYCEQEVRLNRRLAEDIYLGVVAVVAGDEGLRVGAEGEAVEYAVQMRQFSQDAQLDVMLAAGKLEPRHMDAIAKMVADFHQRIAVADSSMPYGEPDAVYLPVEENFLQIDEHINTSRYDPRLQALQQWSESVFGQKKIVFAQRKQDGYVRECHGDMHLRNLMWWPPGEAGRPQAFDCIEFNDSLRWIDVISEVAFLVMDLQDRKQGELANRFLNSWLEITGDYRGLAVLPFYLCYRAMVRAKVSVLRLQQAGISETEAKQALDEFESYIELAESYSRPASPKLIIMRGLSASGKSSVSSALLERTGAIRIRSDVERKRLFAAKEAAPQRQGINSGIYSPEISEKTYKHLCTLAEVIINAGYSVIVDAAFLKQSQRQLFIELANRLGVDFRIIETTAPAEVLRQRIAQRRNDVSDADSAVLTYQLAHYRPLTAEEKPFSRVLDTQTRVDMPALAQWLGV